MKLLDKKNVIFEPEKVKRTDYVEKREIDHLTLYSFDAPLQLFHADIASLEFLGKNATFPQYILVLVDLFSSKVYTYPMESRKEVRQKTFYRDVRSKRKNKKMRLQVDQEFQQVKIRELKTRTAKLFSQKLKMSPRKIIEMSTANMNIRPSKKYGFSPEEVEKR